MKTGAVENWRDPACRQMRLPEWPRADREAWEAALEDSDVLDVGGVAARWAPVTRNGVVKNYGRWLTWCELNGTLIAASPPAARVTHANVAAYLDTLRQQSLSSASVHCYVSRLTMAISAMAPSANWQWLQKIVNRLQQMRVPTDRKRGRVVPARDLFGYGLDLIVEAERDLRTGSLAQAIRYRGGLMIALLAARPFRIRNFGAIELHRHLLPSHDGFYLAFEADETKTKQRLEADVPAALVEPLRRYLAVYRPRLLGGAVGHTCKPTQRLWVSGVGQGITETRIRDQITELTAKRFGRSINPHLFRDCAATSLALEGPSHSSTTMRILGHRSTATAERYYVQAKTQEAARTYQAQVRALRRRG